MSEPITIPNREMISEAVRNVLERYHDAPPEPDDNPQPGNDPHELFYSKRAQRLKEEIVAVGRKLWLRQYVDGNGGNISARLTPEYVICTPTMLSKGDLRVEDLSLVDLENTQIIGSRQQTSEIRLHLAIYKEVPGAEAVIHCHPPYATAHAVAGVAPPGNLVPEQEVFIGPVVLAPYETPGTQAFADTVVPMVRQHNTVLLANHGIVCWADTVTHAEWYTEVIDTYCKTVMIASQLRSPLPEIPPDKILDILEIKKQLGLPDARIPSYRAAALRADAPPAQRHNASAPPRIEGSDELARLAEAITSEVMRIFDSRP